MSAPTFFQADPVQQGTLEKRYLIDPSAKGLSLFRGMYQRIMPFGMESIQQEIPDADFGKKVTVKTNRAGDHLFWTTIQNLVPALKVDTSGSSSSYVTAQNLKEAGCDSDAKITEYLSNVKSTFVLGTSADEHAAHADTAGNVFGAGAQTAAGDDLVIHTTTAGDEHWAVWVDELANVLMEEIVIKCNNNQVDRFTREYDHCHNELFNRKDATQILGIHASQEDAVRSALVDQYVYTPVPAYFCRAMGNLFDLASALFTVPTFVLKYAALTDCIVVSDQSFAVTAEDGSAIKIKQSILDTTQIVVPESERLRLHQHKHKQLISQVQTRTFSKKNQNKVELDVKFPNPALELIFHVRRDCATKANMWFHFWGIGGFDPIAKVELKVNSVSKESERQGEYFRKMKPFRQHTMVPVSCIYTNPFAIDPEAAEFPTGYFTLGRMDSAVLVLTLQSGLADEDVEFFVHARTLNIMEYSNSSARPEFVSS
jgi:hypothetical protein